MISEVPQNSKTYNISYLQIHNYNSQRTKIQIDEVTKINITNDFVNTESNRGNNTKVILVLDQKSL